MCFCVTLRRQCCNFRERQLFPLSSHSGKGFLASILSYFLLWSPPHKKNIWLLGSQNSKCLLQAWNKYSKYYWVLPMWNHHMFCIDNLIKTLQQYHKTGIVITFVLQRRKKKRFRQVRSVYLYFEWWIQV